MCRAGVFLGVALTLLACEPTSRLVVQVRTDLVPTRELELVRVEVSGEGGESWRREVTTSPEQRWGAGVRIAERDLPPGLYRLQITGVSPAGAVLVARGVRAELRGGVQVVTVLLTRDCVGVSCPGSATDPLALACLGGRCVPEMCVEESADTCEAMCVHVSDCAPASDCAQTECTLSGTCFASPDHDLCGPGEACSVVDGCVSVMSGALDVSAPLLLLPPPGGVADLTKNPHISGDGRYLFFESEGSGWGPDDPNGDVQDVYMRDRESGDFVMLTRHPDGTRTGARSFMRDISEDGRFVVIKAHSDTLSDLDSNGVADIYFIDTGEAHAPEPISVSSEGQQANARSLFASVSNDGRYVAFESDATNLVTESTDDGHADVFLRDRRTGETRFISPAYDGSLIDADVGRAEVDPSGRWVVLCTPATNVVPNDTNGVDDIFLYEIATRRITRVTAGGVEPNGATDGPHWADNGRYLGFRSRASNLVPDDNNDAQDVFRLDVETGDIIRVSLGEGGVELNGDSHEVRLSRDGRYVVFGSHATNVTADDVNPGNDYFIRDLWTSEVHLLSRPFQPLEPDQATDIYDLEMPGSARYVVFVDRSDLMVPDDVNAGHDVLIVPTGL